MRKTEIHYFTIADFEEEELWLRDHHANGWKIVRMIPPCIYIFESCEPQDIIYKMDYKNSEQTPEYMRMVEDFGWEYVTQCAGWLYFRKPEEAAESANEGELFSDNESRVEMVSNVIKTRFVPLAIIFVCCIIPNLMNSVSGRLGVASSIFALIFGIMFVIYIYLIVHCGIKLKKIKDRYQM